MVTATIAKTKNNLSKYLGMVKAGESVLILERNRPVARLSPVECGQDGSLDSAKLAGLEASGLIRRPAGRLAGTALLSEPPASTRAGASALAALLAERADAR